MILCELCVLFANNIPKTYTPQNPLTAFKTYLPRVHLVPSSPSMLAEFFVAYLQPYLPTPVVRVLVRWYLYLFVGWRMRSGDVVVRQIKLDRQERTRAPVTTEVEVTNEQLYANDPAFFVAHLGPRLKYSACEWPVNCGASTSDPPSCAAALADAEALTLATYQERLGLASLPAGSRVLECGCGWGSLTLTNAARFPKLHFVAFSNSPQQIEYVAKTAAERGLANVSVHVEDYALFVDPATSKATPPSPSRRQHPRRQPHPSSLIHSQQS